MKLKTDYLILAAAVAALAYVMRDQIAALIRGGCVNCTQGGATAAAPMAGYSDAANLAAATGWANAWYSGGPLPSSIEWRGPAAVGTAGTPADNSGYGDAASYIYDPSNWTG